MVRRFRRPVVRLVLFILVALISVAQAEEPPRYDIEAQRRTLREQYYREVEKVEDAVRRGTLSQQEAARRLRELSQRRLEAARSGAAEYSTAYDQLLGDAQKIREEWAADYSARTGRSDGGWKAPANSGTPLDSPESRGIFGDQDLTFASEADRAALVEAARRRGYTVKGRLGDGYVVIEELDIAAHGPTVRPANPIGPQGRLHTSELVHGHESFATPGSRQLWIPAERTEWTRRDVLGQVADNIKKAEHDLRVDPATLTGWAERERWAQNLSKGTGRAMDAAGKSEHELEAALAAARREGRSATVIRQLENDLAFRHQLAAIKTPMDPRAAGLVPPGANSEETTRILREFQEHAIRQFHEAYRTGVARNGRLLADMDARIAQLSASGKTAEAEALLRERAWIADADTQALRYLAGNPEDGGRILAEIVSGSKLEAVRTSGGIRYRTASGQLLTEDEVASIARRAAQGRATHAPAGGRSWSKAEMADAVLALVILPAVHGTEQELSDAERENRDPRAMYALINTFWEGTQIPEIQRSYHGGEAISRQEIQKELDRIKAMIARGEQPSVIESAIRTVLLSIGRVTGVTDILEAGGELVGLMAATWNELQGPPGDVAALVRQRSGRMLAFVDGELGELEGKRDQMSSLLEQAREPMERMRKAELELYSMRSRLESSRAALADLESRCAGAERYSGQFDAEAPNLAPERERATTALSELQAQVGQACTGNRGDRQWNLASAREAGTTCRDRIETWAATVASLLETASGLKEQLDEMERIRAESDPQGLLTAAPEILERARAAGEKAAGFIEPAILLAHTIAEREKKIRLYLEMLENAHCEEAATRHGGQRLEKLSDSVIDLSPVVVGNQVNTTVESAYDSFEAMRSTLGLDSLQARWGAICPEHMAIPDVSALEEEVRRADRAGQRMDALLARLADCSENRGVISGEVYVSRDEAGTERITRAMAGQQVYLQVTLTARDLERSETVATGLAAVLPGGANVSLNPPAVGVRPGQAEGYRTTAVLPLGRDLQEGTCRVEGTLHLGDRAVALPGMSFEIVTPKFEVSQLTVSGTPGTFFTGGSFAVGDPISFWLDVTGIREGSPLPGFTARWRIVPPDGRVKELEPTGLLDPLTTGEGVLGSLASTIRPSGDLPLGRYRVEASVLLDGVEVARRGGDFNLVPLFEDARLLITDSAENDTAVDRFRPADPMAVILMMTYNGTDPSRLVQVSFNFGGPDTAITELDIGGEKSFARGRDRGTGAARRIPKIIREGSYTATVTLDGGAGQVVRLREDFTVIYPVKFDGIWTRAGEAPFDLRSRFGAGDSYRWHMGYRFVEVRPGDRYSSAFQCQVAGYKVGPLSSPVLGTDSPVPGPGISTYDQIVPTEMPAGAYELQGVVWYNDVAYLSPVTRFRVGQEPTITITSPQPGFMVDRKVLVITGTCADRSLTQATMIANGEQVPIKLNDGAFSAKTVLRPGRNTIRIVAKNGSGIGEDSVWGTADIPAAALKIVLSWEARGTDIDLWVTDPQGVTTNYHNRRPAPDRNLDVDDTSGPGMETYTIEAPLRGRYTVMVHYYSSHGYSGAVPFRLQFTTWEATYQEGHSGTRGTLYKAAGDRNESGAVASFTVPLQ